MRTRRPIMALPILLALTMSLVACDIVDRDPAPADGRVQVVVPIPGQLDVQPIPIDRIVVTVEDRHVTVSAFFTSGVEPCHVLDSVVVRRGATIELTLMEGHEAGDLACRDLGVLKVTEIDLGELDIGPHRITDSGHAPTADITVR